MDLHRRTALRTHARHEVERLLKLPLAAANARFAKIRSPEHRHAVALDLTPAVRDVVGELAVAYDACRAAFAGDEPEIVELGCLVSDAGAAAQPWHADADATRPNTRQLVLLVNLDEHAVAAMELLPGTHATHFHAHVRDAFGGRLPDPPGLPALRAFDAAGAAVLYDAALLYPVWKSTSALGVEVMISTQVPPRTRERRRPAPRVLPGSRGTRRARDAGRHARREERAPARAGWDAAAGPHRRRALPRRRERVAARGLCGSRGEDERHLMLCFVFMSSPWLRGRGARPAIFGGCAPPPLSPGARRRGHAAKFASSPRSSSQPREDRRAWRRGSSRAPPRNSLAS